MGTLEAEAPADCSGAGLRRKQQSLTAATNLSTSPETLAKALASRRVRIIEGRQKYQTRADDSHWVRLATSRGFRLPETWVAPTPHKLRQWVKRVLDPENSLTLADLPPRTWGFDTWADAIKANPAWSLRSFVGLMLEEAASVAR